MDMCAKEMTAAPGRDKGVDARAPVRSSDAQVLGRGQAELQNYDFVAGSRCHTRG
jgi:hypothetical protein